MDILLWIIVTMEIYPRQDLVADASKSALYRQAKGWK
jgi:hypothetical protein